MPTDHPSSSEDLERWQRVWEVFDRALVLTGTARTATLEELCGDDDALRREVESLLNAHDQENSLVDNPLVNLRSAVLEDTPPQPNIDRYELLETLGSGGMGQVFAARRADGLYDEVVAVKVLKRGLDTDALVRRFHAERRILARLAHPHIARLLDGGSTEDGRPYLVMERVAGTPIDLYCDDHRLSIPQRLELFQRICRAVHFAHRNLVIHRDLKPGNILITEAGDPKLLDFGIAKLLAPQPETDGQVLVTQPGQAPMTPQYASPEQVLGKDTTTASDVYSLGMLLYQLLTGDLPYHLGPSTNLVDVVCESNLDRPAQRVAVGRSAAQEQRISTEELSSRRNTTPAALQKTLQGDLDNIVLMALAKEPEERYASAEALAEDLERFAEGLPVRAQASTLGYRTRKFVRRHRLAVALSTTILAALLFLLGTLLVQRQQILDERDRVVEERNRATTVSDFLIKLFAIPDPTRAQGETVTARQLLERGVDQIETELASQPRVQSSLMLTMGRSQAGLGLYEEALALLRRSLELRQGAGADGEEAVAEAFFRLSEVLSFAGHYEEAEPMLRQALATYRQVLGPEDAKLAEVHMHFAHLLAKQGHFDQARAEFIAAEEVTRPLGEEVLLSRILDRHAGLLQNLGDLDLAQALFDESLALNRKIHGASHPWLALSLNNSAWLAAERGDFERAEALYQEAEEMQRHLFDGDHPHLATTLANRGLLYSQKAELDEAEDLLTQALNMFKKTLGDMHPKVATTLSNLATIETKRGQSDVAEAHYREVLEIQHHTLGAEHAETAITLNNLGLLLSLEGRLEEAAEMFKRALKASRKALGPEHPQVGATLCNLAEVAQQLGDLETSERLFREAIEILRRGLENHSNLAAALINLAALEQRKGDLDGATANSEEAVAVMRKALGDSHPDVAMTLTRLASLHAEVGRYSEAEAEASEALEIFRAKLPSAEAWIGAAEGIRDRSRAQTQNNSQNNQPVQR